MAQAEAKDSGERTVLSMHDTILETSRFKSDIEYGQNARRKAKQGDPDQSPWFLSSSERIGTRNRCDGSTEY